MSSFRSVRRVLAASTAIAAIVAGTVVAGTIDAQPASAASSPTTVSTRAAVPAVSSSKTAAPAFRAAFWSPYFVTGAPGNAAQIATAMAAQKAAGDTDIIIEWSVHYDAKDAAYPAAASLGFAQWNDAVPTFLAAAKKQGMRVWMGLAVAPTSIDTLSTITTQSWLNSFAAAQKSISNDLYAKYGAQIAGWYLPTEPAQLNIATPARAAQFGAYLGSVSDYLHSHNGGKPVMVSPSMPTAQLSGLSALQFVSELSPLISAAHVDVLNLQDGYEMTAWTPAQEAAAFSAVKKLTDAAHAQLWASVYTPVVDGNGVVPVARMEPYLKSIGGLGVTLSEWEFNGYLDPDPTLPNGAQMSANYREYLGYLGL